MPADTASPFVSTVVPVRNGETTLRECLVSLLRVDYPAERREILVVDNGSTDRTAEIVRSFPVEYVVESRPGQSHARNRGIQTSRGEIVSFIDADCTVTTGWLRELVQGFESDATGAVVGEMVAYLPTTPAERYHARRKPAYNSRSLAYPASPWFLSANVAFRRGVFDRIGLFDPRFMGNGCEDIDFAWRFLDSGSFDVKYRPRALAFHRHRATTRGLFRQYRGYGSGQAILSRKYPERIRWGWRREMGAYGDLLRAALSFGRLAIGPRDTRDHEAVSQQYLELIRKLGERIGFTAGMLGRS